MFWIDKRSYMNTLAIMRKGKTMTPMFSELKQFIESEFGITVYNITYEPNRFFNKPKKYFNNDGKRMRLTCQVASYEEREVMQKRIDVDDIGGHAAYKMVPDEKKQTLILVKFFELAEKYNFSVGAEANEIWLDYHYWFPIDHMNFIVSKVERETSKRIIHKYKQEAGIWQIISNGYAVIVFYKTEAQKSTNSKSGISDAIKKEYFSAINAIDEFGFYKVDYITFDTKENFVKNYKGNWYSYLR
jgi:hypothetical protein